MDGRSGNLFGMKVFYSDAHAVHAPTWYVADGCVRPCPEVAARAVEIMRVLEGMGIEVDRPGREGVDAWPAIRAVHDRGYLDYLRTIHDLWTAEFGACDVIPDTFVRRVNMKRPTKPSAQAGFYCFDMAAPITAGTWEAAFGSASCAVGAVDAVVRGDVGAYALCRPPGHHAGRDYCGGFCYLNNAAIAAEHLLMRGKKRVAIFDVDYHHGNGTQDIFYSREDVLFVSVHAEPETQYPYFWGYAEERGEGAGEGFNLNLPLARGSGEEVWLGALDTALERIAAFAPDALLVSLGADIYEADGVGDFGVTLEGFGQIGRRMRALRLPTVFVQEGGYNVEKIGDCVGAVLKGFERS